MIRRFYIFLFLSFLQFGFAQQPYLFSAEESIDLLNRANFRSQEQLLQLFILGLRDSIPQNNPQILFSETEIKKLSTQIKTLFPIQNLQKLEVFQDTVVLQFNEGQKFSIPGSWGMVKVLFTPYLKFHVKAFDQSWDSIELRLVDGTIRLETNWFARLFTPLPSSLRGKRIRYWCNDAHKSSGISLIEVERPPSKVYFYQESLDGFSFQSKSPDYDHVILAPGYGKWNRTEFKWRGRDSLWINSALQINAQKVEVLQKKYLEVIEQRESVQKRDPTLYFTNEVNYLLEEQIIEVLEYFGLD